MLAQAQTRLLSKLLDWRTFSEALLTCQHEKGARLNMQKNTRVFSLAFAEYCFTGNVSSGLGIKPDNKAN
jgi:hypothetical protein